MERSSAFEDTRACGLRVAAFVTAITFLEWLSRWLGDLVLEPRLLARRIPMALALAAPVFLLGRAGRWYGGALVLVSGLLGILQIEMMILFKSTFRREIFDIVASTNPGDLTEFLVSFSTVKSLGVLVLGGALVVRAARRVARRRTRLTREGAVVGLALVLPLAAYAYVLLAVKQRPLEELMNRNSLTQLVHDFGEFDGVRRRYTHSVFKPDFPARIARTDWSRDPRFAGVVVIGESTSRNHMGLYGYPRPTTPVLGARARELVVFQDAISAHAFTGDAVRAALTIGIRGEQPPAICTVPNLARRAGYRVEVISNQEFIDYHSAGINLMFKDADWSFFSWKQAGVEYPSLDARLVKPFADRVSWPGGPTLFFVHLLGTHNVYRNRYPASFARFDGVRDACNRHVDEAKARIINEYDNAVLYNDFILGRLLEALERSGRPGFLVYFSDHGEAVFEDGHSFMHAPGVSNRHMYEVPLIAWLSPALRTRAPALLAALRANAGRGVQTDALSYALIELLGISCPDFPSARSIASPAFQPVARRINGEDYEAVLQRSDSAR